MKLPFNIASVEKAISDVQGSGTTEVILDVPDAPLCQIYTGIPRPKSNGDGFGFSIRVFPGWKTLVSRIMIPDHESQKNWMDSVGSELLEGCGYDLKVYGRFGAIRLSFGEWGLEHITIPGNGCGLDITSDSCFCPDGGRVMLSHNVDSMKQAYLLQCIFNWWANHWILEDDLNSAVRKIVTK